MWWVMASQNWLPQPLISERAFLPGIYLYKEDDKQLYCAAGPAAHTLISGGLGALASLVAAWLTGALAVAHQPALTLLGRSGRISDPSASRLLAASHHWACLCFLPEKCMSAASDL